ncbi:hypothetical protein EV360DRAFT_78418 [Lentinula raphanica]|nr:hypothetical protein EV360DRAFT_78418 [Lentinula raphanica]
MYPRTCHKQFFWPRDRTGQNSPVTNTYDTTSGQPNSGSASPAQGAMFALLAVNATRQSSGSNAPVAANRGSKVNKADAIAGGIIGGVAFLALVALVVFFYRKLKGRKRNRVHSSGQTINKIQCQL